MLREPGALDWNREVLYADTATPEVIVMAGLPLPLFGGHRLVLVRGLAAASARVVERLRAAVDEARNRPGGWPVEGTLVVFVASGVDRRSAVHGLLPEGERVEIRGPAGRALVGWLVERARAAELTLPPRVAQILIELAGEDLMRLAGEIDKAAVYAGEHKQLSEEIVRMLAGETRVRQYWELTQALEGGDRVQALRLLEHLLTAGEEPLLLLACVVGYLRDLWRLSAGLAESQSPGALARLLPRRRPEWAVERLVARAAEVGPAGIAAGVKRCFEVERALKTSAASPRALLTVLVADIAR